MTKWTSRKKRVTQFHIDYQAQIRDACNPAPLATHYWDQKKKKNVNQECKIPFLFAGTFQCWPKSCCPDPWPSSPVMELIPPMLSNTAEAKLHCPSTFPNNSIWCGHLLLFSPCTEVLQHVLQPDYISVYWLKMTSGILSSCQVKHNHLVNDHFCR